MNGQVLTITLELSMLLNEIIIQPANSLLNKGFRKQLESLPPQIQQIAKEKYLRWRKDYRTLNFERKFKDIYVIEITHNIHAICQITNNIVYWFWVGKYDEYYAYLNALRKIKS